MKTYDIKSVSKELGLSEVYVRRMILKGKIQTTKVEIAKNTYKHVIAEDEVNKWRGGITRSKREDGRAKYNLYSSQEEFEVLVALLKENKIDLPIVRANNVKKVSAK